MFAANREGSSSGQTLYFRRYPTARARRADDRLLDRVALAGRSRALDERLPHRREHEPQQRVQAGARQARRRNREGQQSRAHDRPKAQRLAQKLLGSTLRRGRRDEPAHGRGVRDGVDADVRPESDRPAERLREGAEDPRRLRRRVGAAQPRDAGPLHAGLDVQDRSRPRPRSTRARSTPSSTFDDPGYCTEYGQQVSNAGNPDQGGPEVFGHVNFVTAFQHSINSVFCNIGKKIGAGDDPRLREEVRLLQDAAARDAGERARAERARTRDTHLYDPKDPNQGRPGPARVRPERRCS